MKDSKGHKNTKESKNTEKSISNGLFFVELLKYIFGGSFQEVENKCGVSVKTLRERWSKQQLLSVQTNSFRKIIEAMFVNNEAGKYADRIFKYLEKSGITEYAEKLHREYLDQENRFGNETALENLMEVIRDDCNSGKISRILNDDQKDSDGNKPEKFDDSYGLDDFERSIRSSFIKLLKSLEILEYGRLFSVQIKLRKDWLPNVYGKGMVFADYITDNINNNSLKHVLLYCEGGSGKTYSMIDTAIKFFNNKVCYRGREIVPVFIPARFAEGIIKYIAIKLIQAEVEKTEELTDRLFSSGKKHYILFIDAINECDKLQALKAEIGRLADPFNETLTLIVSCIDKDELSLDGWDKVTLDAINDKFIASQIKDRIRKPSVSLLKLLGRPFYLKTFMELENVVQSNVNRYYDLFTIVESFLDTQLSKNPADGNDIQDVLYDEYPNICYDLVIRHGKYFAEYKEECKRLGKPGIDFLIKNGVLLNYENYLVFKHEIYCDFFCAYKIIKTCRSLVKENVVPEVREKLLNGLQEFLTASFPLSVYKIISANLYNSGLLLGILNEFGAEPYNNDIQLQANLIRMLSLVTSDITGVDFSSRNLWFSDFTPFRKLNNCNFNDTVLNPEALWMFDTKLYYDQSNKELFYQSKIFIADNRIIEIYDLSTDHKVCLKSGSSIKDLRISSNSLIIADEEGIYDIPMPNIDTCLANDSRDVELKVDGISGAEKYVLDTGKILDLK